MRNVISTNLLFVSSLMDQMELGVANASVLILVTPPRSNHFDPVFEGVPAACFPAATGLASSWDTDFIQTVGKTIALDCKDKGVLNHRI
jgi:beta-glucosidase-like glycosyl hydrolase